ncbi:MAG: helix-turn-helix domain-containing protein [Bdellovibrionales bacterium]
MSHGVDGWLKFARRSLNMSVGQLSKRTGLAPSSIYQAERNEAEGQINLATLRRLANAMDFELVYSLVPRAPIMQMIKNQASEKALQKLGSRAHYNNMSDVQVDALRMELDELIQNYLKSKELWD